MRKREKYQLYLKVRNLMVMLLFVFIGVDDCFAQQLMVDDFAKVKKPLLRATPGCDKGGAVINYAVSEMGFEFTAAGEQVVAQEGDESLLIVVPKKTSFVEISHPEYGKIYWKSPQKLKRKRVYSAQLYSDNPKSEYKISKQWVVIEVDPKDAIIEVDTTFTKLRSGEMQLYLPIGKHPIKISSPFHETMSDTLDLDDKGVLRVKYELRPTYSYIEVETTDPADRKATLSINGTTYPVGSLRSGRLLAGRYVVSLERPKYQSRSVVVELGDNDRKIVKMPSLQPIKREKDIFSSIESEVVDTIAKSAVVANVVSDSLKSIEVKSVAKRSVMVTLTPFDDECEVLINREVVARGEWCGELAEGGYYFMTRRDGLESRSIYCEVKGDYPLKMELPTPLAYYGKLNVASNVAGAKVYLNGELVGVTPLIIHNLDRSIRYDVELCKDGYKGITQRVKLSGNALERVDLKLKRERSR